MDPWDFLKYAAPLAALAGVAFALVNQAFKWVWRLAQVEEKADANCAEIIRVEEEASERDEKLKTQLECLPRIEVRIEQLFEERHTNVIRSSASA